MRLLNANEKEKIKELYRKGSNCVEIKEIMGLKHHQQVLNVLKKLPEYIPYKWGRGDLRTYTLDEDFFSIINTEEKAYLLGHICADGHVDTTTYRLSYLIQTLDKELLEKFKIILGSNAPIKNMIVNSRFSYGKRLFYHSKIDFCSKRLVQDLQNLGLVSNKTYVLNESIISTIDESLIRHFLRGYFDGDGSIILGKDLKKISVEVLANLDFINGTFNKYFPTNTKIGKAKNSRQSYYYRITKRSEILKFLHYIYKDSTIYLQRKYDKYLFLCGHLKQGELLETPVKDNQQPSLGSNSFEGSETNSRLYNIESNGDTSALPNYIKSETEFLGIKFILKDGSTQFIKSVKI